MELARDFCGTLESEAEDLSTPFWGLERRAGPPGVPGPPNLPAARLWNYACVRDTVETSRRFVAWLWVRTVSSLVVKSVLVSAQSNTCGQLDLGCQVSFECRILVE
jgi:hypothetical protein